MSTTVTVRDLRVLLAAVIPFTGTDDHPVLACVRVEARGGVICATATDRYSVGHVRRKSTGDLDAVHLHRDDVAEIVSWLDSYLAFSDRRSELVEVDAGENMCRLKIGNVMQTVPVGPVTWPKLSHHVAEAASGEVVGPVALGPSMLGKLTAAVAALGMVRGERILWQMGGQKSAVRVEVGGGFVAIAMPLEPVDETGTNVANLTRVPFGLPGDAADE